MAVQCRFQIDAITRNPRQPRQSFKEDELEELAASIREHGIIQPLIVSPAIGGTYTLIAGERRWQAARRAGLRTVPVVMRVASDQQLLELALIENVQRADLNPIEEAEAFQHLAKEFGLSHEAIASRVGKSRVAVTNTIRLLEPARPSSRRWWMRRISEGHARALLALGSARAQEVALQRVINLDLSVRQTELLARKLSGHKPASKRKAAAMQTRVTSRSACAPAWAPRSISSMARRAALSPFIIIRTKSWMPS